MRIGAVPLIAVVALAYSAPGPSTFRLAPDAQDAMHDLWRGSVTSHVERVACLASTIDGDTVHITRILPLTDPGIDSLAVRAGASLDTCGPPTWQGTVHTHIALYDGQRPYSTFSGADRGVMLNWGRRWNALGTFCLLYTETMIHCELDGPSGSLIFPSTTY